MKRTHAIQKEREVALADLGIALHHREDGKTLGVFSPQLVIASYCVSSHNAPVTSALILSI